MSRLRQKERKKQRKNKKDQVGLFIKNNVEFQELKEHDVKSNMHHSRQMKLVMTSRILFTDKASVSNKWPR